MREPSTDCSRNIAITPVIPFPGPQRWFANDPFTVRPTLPYVARGEISGGIGPDRGAGRAQRTKEGLPWRDFRGRCKPCLYSGERPGCEPNFSNLQAI